MHKVDAVAGDDWFPLEIGLDVQVSPSTNCKLSDPKPLFEDKPLYEEKEKRPQLTF